MPRNILPFPSILRRIFVAAIFALPVALPSQGDAGTYQVKGHQSGNHSFRGARHGFPSPQRGFRARYGHPSGFNPRFAHRGSIRQNIAIVIAAPQIAGIDDRSAKGGNAEFIFVEEGVCRAGRYCTLRLGRASNAPKIITLNLSGSAISCLDGQCGATGRPAVK